jgi:hypothetical protein
MLVGLMVVNNAPALAACHHFSVSASPASVAEGGKVLVTVSRDGNFAASSIHLSTIDETAKAGTDYVALNQTVAFAANGAVQKQYTLSTMDDHLAEPSQTFRLHLGNPSGCFVNTSFVVDPDVRVTIKDNPVKPTPTKSPTAKATAKPTVVPVSPTPTSSVKSSLRGTRTVTPSASPTTSPSSSQSGIAAAASSKDGGRGAFIWLDAILIILATVGTFVLRRRRRTNL